MLSGRQQPMGSLELTYWGAYLRVRDERDGRIRDAAEALQELI